MISPSLGSLRVDRPGREARVAFLPSGAEAYQVPPTPWPLVSPALVSLAYRYIGQPPIVSCLVPSERVTSPSSALSTPVAATAPSAGTGGQAVAQSPSQFDFGGSAVSFSKRYRVNPALSVSTLPSV